MEMLLLLAPDAHTMDMVLAAVLESKAYLVDLLARHSTLTTTWFLPKPSHGIEGSESTLPEWKPDVDKYKKKVAKMEKRIKAFQAEVEVFLEANQRILWEYLPQHDSSLSLIPPLAHDVMESVTIVGDYTIHGTLGEGQYAAVYACSRNASKLNDITALVRVHSEISALSDPALRHPSLLSVKHVIHTAVADAAYSAHAKALLQAMLTEDAENRPTIYDVAEHPWFDGHRRRHSARHKDRLVKAASSKGDMAAAVHSPTRPTSAEHVSVTLPSIKGPDKPHHYPR
ncbi:hypothetical protein DYB36_009139 [Aphanomyces astaci]|uniref:Protein kinase domain-containing protein n=1 Tax=Aphanomyces astaci TaxID=112090 RepID=A0A397AFV0_APHAT|nr:hypothetical protein DYB36_009139 [Aphanomyces astaci]